MRARPKPPPRTRKRAAKAAPKWERKAEARPEELFEAAIDAFSRGGYHATRLEAVAEAAGVSKGTIYNYFKNKEDLLCKALDHRLRRLLLKVEADLGNFRGSAEDKLRHFLEGFSSRALTEDWGRVQKLMHGEIAAAAPELFRFWIRNGMLQGWKLIADLIEAGQAAGEFRKDVDARGAARFAMSGLANQAFLQVHMGVCKLDDYPVKRTLATGLDLLLQGLRAPAKGKKGKP
jgi:AcrR family transcriptional regulator